MANQIDLYIKELLANQKSSDKELEVFEKLNNLIPQAENICENSLYKLISLQLVNTNLKFQKIAFQALVESLKRGLFKSVKSEQLGYLVLNIVDNIDENDAERQELYFKALTALDNMQNLKLFQAKTHQVIELLNYVIMSEELVEKVSALKMLNDLLVEEDVSNNDEIQKVLIPLWFKKICPYMFDISQPNLQNMAINASYTMLPILQNAIQRNNQLFTEFTDTLTKSHLSVMLNLVENNNISYSKLWIFLSKMLAARFHQIFPVVNVLLQVIELAFKSQVIEIRLQAFYCWQCLIESFAQNPKSFFNEKRLKLLILPLKAHNGRTEEIVALKFQTWCKLLNTLNKKNIILTDHSIFNFFLQFCFGRFYDQPLLSYFSGNPIHVGQGKKFPNLYLNSCKAFLQLFAFEKYIDKSLKAKLNFFDFDNQKIKLEKKFDYTKSIIHSVGECCVQLTYFLKSDKDDCLLILNALWKTLFESIDSLKDDNFKKNCCSELSLVVHALIGVSKKFKNFTNFALIPLFDIITSDYHFFKEDNMSNILFVPIIQNFIKKDKTIQQDMIEIPKKIFHFKNTEKEFLKFVQSVLDRSLVNLDNISPEKVQNLQNIWLVLEKELKKFIQNLNSVDDKIILSFSNIFIWPVIVLNFSFEQEIAVKWKELYFQFSKKISETDQLSLAKNILKIILDFSEKQNYFLISANVTLFIVSQLNYSKYCAETFSSIVEIFIILKTLLLKNKIDEKTIAIYVKAVKYIFNNSENYPFCLQDEILDCITCLLSTYKNFDILNDINIFVVSFKNVSKHRNDFDKLIHILKSSNLDQDLLSPILNNYSSVLNQIMNQNPRLSKIFDSPYLSDSIQETRKNNRRKQVFESKECPEIGNSKAKNYDFRSKKSDKIMSLLGHDLETLNPLKIKSKSTENIPKKSLENMDEIFVNTPYKFDPKKLTKSQKEKLSKKPEDIPALYQDLSQSQSQNFEDSCSITVPEIISVTENPFTGLVREKTDIIAETAENESKTNEGECKTAEKTIKVAETAEKESKTNEGESQTAEKTSEAAKTAEKDSKTAEKTTLKKIKTVEKINRVTKAAVKNRKSAEKLFKKVIKTLELAKTTEKDSQTAGKTSEIENETVEETNEIAKTIAKKIKTAEKSPKTVERTPELAKTTEKDDETAEKTIEKENETVEETNEIVETIAKKIKTAEKSPKTVEKTPELAKTTEKDNETAEKLIETIEMSPETAENQPNSDSNSIFTEDLAKTAEKIELRLRKTEELLQSTENFKLKTPSNKTKPKILKSKSAEIEKLQKLKVKILKPKPKTVELKSTNQTETIDSELKTPKSSELVQTKIKLSLPNLENDLKSAESQEDVPKLVLIKSKPGENIQIVQRAKKTNFDSINLGDFEENFKKSRVSLIESSLSQDSEVSFSETGVNMSEKLKKPRVRRQLVNKNVSEPDSIEPSSENTLNIAKIINSDDLASLNSSDSRKRGRKTKKYDDFDYETRSPRTAKRVNKKASETIEEPPKTIELMDKMRQQRVKRELERLKLDCNYSEEFKQNVKKRKTRSGSLVGPTGGEDLKMPQKRISLERIKKMSPKYTESSSDSSDRNSVEEAITIPSSESLNEELESLKNCKVMALYHLESVKPGEHLIIDEKTDILKIQDSTSPFRIVQHTNIPPEINSDTPTLNTEILAEIQPESDSVSFGCRKILFDENPPESPPKKNLPSSPVLQDTPTRNKELILNTRELSPIKLSDKSENLDFEPVPGPSKIKKRAPKKPANRSAQIIDMCGKKNQRIKKLSISDDESEKIQNEDILVLTRQIPNFDTPPLPSILKKRKIEDVSEDSPARPSKRRRVNFSDPPVSSQKYIEKNTRQKCSSVKLDLIPNKPRITRSSKNEPENDENIDNTDLIYTIIGTKNIENPNLDAETTVEKFLENISKDIISPTPEISLKLVKKQSKTDELPEKTVKLSQSSPEIMSCEVSVITKTAESLFTAKTKESSLVAETVASLLKTVETPVKTAETTESSIKSTNKTAKTKESPLATAESLLETVENPIKTTESSIKSTKKAAKTKESPLATAESLLETVENPVETAKTNESLIKSTIKAAKTKESSLATAETAESLLEIVENPIKTPKTNEGSLKSTKKTAKKTKKSLMETISTLTSESSLKTSESLFSDILPHAENSAENEETDILKENVNGVFGDVLIKMISKCLNSEKNFENLFTLILSQIDNTKLLKLLLKHVEKSELINSILKDSDLNISEILRDIHKIVPLDYLEVLPTEEALLKLINELENGSFLHLPEEIQNRFWKGISACFSSNKIIKILATVL